MPKVKQVVISVDFYRIFFILNAFKTDIVGSLN